MNKLIHYQEIIEESISKYQLPSAPSNLYDPLRYFLALGGKRMRPVAVLLAADAFGTKNDASLQAALAIELFHNFSLIHDDIMDEAPLRRGKETVHIKWNRDVAILSGDQLLIEAFKCIASCGETSLPILNEFNKTATEVCEGQQMDMDFEQRSDVNTEEYIQMIAYKTAVLLACSFKVGAMSVNASEKDASLMYQFGLNLGISFQLQDDYLDVFGDSSNVGKQEGGDILANKKTFLLLSALQSKNVELVNELVHHLNHSQGKDKVANITRLFKDLSIDELTRNEMKKYHDLAIQSLDELGIPSKNKAPLYDLAEFLLDRNY